MLLLLLLLRLFFFGGKGERRKAVGKMLDVTMPRPWLGFLLTTDFNFLSFDELPLKRAQQNKNPFSPLGCLTTGFHGRDAHLNYTVVSSAQCLIDCHLSNELLCGI